MMAKEEYIKRDGVLQAAKELQGELFGIPLIIKAIEDAPTEDVVEVVRCKDCKHSDTDAFGRTVCMRDFQVICVKDNDFCSYGDKK